MSGFAVGRWHPLLLHFPIAFLLGAAAAEIVAMATGRDSWRVVVITCLRAGALGAVLTAAAGWSLARAPFVEPGALLEWHRWLGVATAAAATLAAASTVTSRPHAHRIPLFLVAALVAVTAHLGGLLVWGAAFLTH